MPLAHLIFFEEPRELTDAQIAEAREAGLLREDEPPSPGPLHPRPRSSPAAPADPGNDDASNDGQGDTGPEQEND